MGYIDKNLMSDEQVLYKAKIYRFCYVPAFVQLLALASFFSPALLGVDLDSGVGILIVVIASIGLFLGTFFLIKARITQFSTEVAITTKRVIVKVGLLRRNTVELNHSKVASLTVHQSIFGRLFDFGTIIINGTGGSKTSIPNIDSPLEFRRNAMAAIDASQVRQD